MPDWIALDDYARRESSSADTVWKRIREGQLTHREEGGLHYVRERDELTKAPEGLVPSSYAEKAMASLLRLHDELMDEKNARLALYEKLMEKEQSLAELKGYVRLLEEKLSRSAADLAERPKAAPPAELPVAEKPPVAPPPVQVATPAAAPAPPLAAPQPRVAAPTPAPSLQPEAPRRSEGWRTW